MLIVHELSVYVKNNALELKIYNLATYSTAGVHAAVTRHCSALKHVADVAKTWGKLSPRLQRKKEKSRVALLKVTVT